jgi:hypothetical protein
MGFLLGLMAEPEVSLMTTKFVDNIIFDFFNIGKISESSKLVDYIVHILIDLIGECTKKMLDDIPQELIDEMNGLYDGCLTVNPESKVQMDALRALNLGIDYLLAHIYTGKIFKEKKIPPFLLKLPIMCNAISISRKAAEDGCHYFGRDFMFATADVFQDAACLIIYNPESTQEKPAFPVVSQTAPGFIGSIAAMNINGVAIGVDMLPGSHCNPDRPGLNSLLLNRYCIQTCPTIYDAIQKIIDAPRGVSWLYPIADGQSGRSCIIEAGSNTGDAPFDYFSGIPDHYKNYLPDEEFINEMRTKYRTPAPQKGLMVRWDDYPYPDDYLKFNEKLWDQYNSDFWSKLEQITEDLIKDLIIIIKDPSILKIVKAIAEELMELFKNVKYSPGYWVEMGYINKTYYESNCPGPFYFAPQREPNENISIVANHYTTPEMRLTAMTEWIAFVESSHINGFQWRYDELNREILQFVNDKAKITEVIAQDIIDFLRPYPNPRFPEYYNPGIEKDPKEIIIGGSTSLFELKNKWIKSHFGYYGDEWIKITLPNYTYPKDAET